MIENDWNEENERRLQQNKKEEKTNTMKNILSVEQSNQYLEIATSYDPSALFLLAVKTGMRLPEILNLCWTDLDLSSGNIYVNSTLSAMGHTNLKIRGIELDSETNDMLIKQRAIQISNKDKRNIAHSDLHHVFLSTTGNQLSRDHIIKIHRNILRKSNLPLIGFHHLRHTHVMHLINNNIDHKIICERLGFSYVDFLHMFSRHF